MEFWRGPHWMTLVTAWNDDIIHAATFRTYADAQKAWTSRFPTRIGSGQAMRPIISMYKTALKEYDVSRAAEERERINGGAPPPLHHWDEDDYEFDWPIGPVHSPTPTTYSSSSYYRRFDRKRVQEIFTEAFADIEPQPKATTP